MLVSSCFANRRLIALNQLESHLWFISLSFSFSCCCFCCLFGQREEDIARWICCSMRGKLFIIMIAISQRDATSKRARIRTTPIKGSIVLSFPRFSALRLVYSIAYPLVHLANTFRWLSVCLHICVEYLPLPLVSLIQSSAYMRWEARSNTRYYSIAFKYINV